MHHGKILSYSILSSAFLLCGPEAEGQVWYKKFEPDTLLDTDDTIVWFFEPFPYYEYRYELEGSHQFDLNRDGIEDFAIKGYFETYSSSGYQDDQEIIKLSLYNSNRVVTGSRFLDAYSWVKQLREGDTIGSALFSFDGSDAYFVRYDFYWQPLDPWGEWTNSGGSMGIEVLIEGQPHYGWVRMKRDLDGRIKVREYMLAAEPNRQISVGENPCQKTFNLEAVPIGLNKVMLKWEDVYNADKYQLRGREVGSGIPSKEFSSVNSKEVSGLAPGSTYEWQVRARCSDGTFTTFSETLVFTMPEVAEQRTRRLRERTD